MASVVPQYDLNPKDFAVSFRYLIRVVAYIGAAAPVAACGNHDQPVAPNPLSACDGPVTVSVSGGPTPTISWSPVCGENRLFVDMVNPSASFQATWAITSGDLFGPSVKYGSAPSGAETTAPAGALLPGTKYTVTVMRSSGEVIIKGEGSATFTP